jgi:hypothetical protein
MEIGWELYLARVVDAKLVAALGRVRGHRLATLVLTPEGQGGTPNRHPTKFEDHEARLLGFQMGAHPLVR